MEQKEIIEGNILIAKFMGFTQCIDEKMLNADKLMIHPTTKEYIPHGMLTYNFSWDWLMSVVYKINNIDNHEYDVIIWRSDCHINNRMELLFESSILKGNKTLIETVWGCIVEFIKWYNLNQPVNNKP